MLKKEKLERINHLAKKSKEQGLTDEEKKRTGSFKKRIYKKSSEKILKIISAG